MIFRKIGLFWLFALGTALPVVAQQNTDRSVLSERAYALSQKIYSESHTHLLSPDQRREISTLLKDIQEQGRWRNGTSLNYWTGYFNFLIFEDDRNRDKPHEILAQGLYNAAVGYQNSIVDGQMLERSYFGLGMVRAAENHYTPALKLFQQAVRIANQTPELSPNHADAVLTKFQATKWAAEMRARLFDWTNAMADFDAFYSKNGNNTYDQIQQRVDLALMARDFDRAKLEMIALRNAYPEHAPTHAAIGYLQTLLGLTADAEQHYTQAIQREKIPTLYPRLWQWIGTPADQREQQIRSLNLEILSQPDTFLKAMSSWDTRLLGFMLGVGGTPEEDKLWVASASEARRRGENLELNNDLTLETWVYIGLKRASLGQRDAALNAFEQALREPRPERFKWEFELARCKILGSKPFALGDAIKNQTLKIREDSALTLRILPNKLAKITHWRSPDLGDRMDTPLRPGDTAEQDLKSVPYGTLIQALVVASSCEAVTLIAGIDF